MDEMERRGYHPDIIWRVPEYRGKVLSIVPGWADADIVDDQCAYAVGKGGIIYPEHDEAYLRECIELLKEKQAPINFQEMEKLI
jgi:uncharacterized protein (TIGR02328 family)